MKKKIVQQAPFTVLVEPPRGAIWDVRFVD